MTKIREYQANPPKDEAPAAAPAATTPATTPAATTPAPKNQNSCIYKEPPCGGSFNIKPAN